NIKQNRRSRKKLRRFCFVEQHRPSDSFSARLLRAWASIGLTLPNSLSQYRQARGGEAGYGH
ncbi:hypothetical protein, partial [Sulfitobacter dubius]|uniref:hypothetical protein n=1 Tax=Sulfitobacter dubius TaxID=218673 RepID=UPI0030DB5D22